MANNNYSLKERMIAKVLSKTPGLKRIIKNIYVRINAKIYKKGYTFKIVDTKIGNIYPAIENLQEDSESFFGYYDKCPMNKDGWVINHVTRHNTAKLISENDPIDIILSNLYTKEKLKIATSYAYTWQQGSRSQWITDDLVIYNDYDENGQLWVAKVYSLSKQTIVRTFDRPVQDAFQDHYFLSLDYQRLYNLTDDYGYHNKGFLSSRELEDIDNDGIFSVDYVTGRSKLIYSFRDILQIGFLEEFGKAVHSVNHIMINGEGTAFMFIHRYYINGRRKDRLMVSDFNHLDLIVQEGMVSHCCWINASEIYGYMRQNGCDGYFTVDIKSREWSENRSVSSLGLGDGHPTFSDNIVIFDTYPDKSRMQHLMLFNKKKSEVTHLLELYNPVQYTGASRCDLHPRFAREEKMVFFDAVFEGKRKQYYIQLNK